MWLALTEDSHVPGDVTVVRNHVQMTYVTTWPRLMQDVRGDENGSRKRIGKQIYCVQFVLNILIAKEKLEHI